MYDVTCKANRYDWTAVLSNTVDFRGTDCEIYSGIASPPAAELALRNDYSKFYCTGGKFILVPEYLMKRQV